MTDIRFHHQKREQDSMLMPSYLRSNRYFHVMNDGWYVESRSGQYGPFRYHKDAEQFVRALLDDEPVRNH